MILIITALVLSSIIIALVWLMPVIRKQAYEGDIVLPFLLTLIYLGGWMTVITKYLNI